MSVGLRGRVIVDKKSQLSQEALKHRLNVLETALLGSQRTAKFSEKSIADRVKAVDDHLDSLETNNVKIFKIGLGDIGPRLGNWTKAVVPPGTVPDQVKEKIVDAEAHDLKKTCTQLEKITQLQSSLNPAYLNEMPVYLERVSTLETNYVCLSKKIGDFQKNLQKTLRDYNEIMDLLSLKAAEWDDALSNLEQKVNTSEPE